MRPDLGGRDYHTVSLTSLVRSIADLLVIVLEQHIRCVSAATNTLPVQLLLHDFSKLAPA